MLVTRTQTIFSLSVVPEARYKAKPYAPPKKVVDTVC
jgi:hypothetical protein